MADQRLRELERRWRESGDPADEAAYLRARVRSGAGRGAASQDDAALAASLLALVEGAQVPGLALALVRPTGPVVCATSGPVTPETLFPLCEATMVVTALALLELEARERLDRHQPFAQLVPGLTPPGLDDEARAQLTLAALLAHTGGIGEDEARPAGQDLAAWARERAPRLPAIARPGEVFWHSRAGFDLAGLVAQAVTGTRFDRLVRELITGPLGLQSLTFEPGRAAGERARPARGEGLGPELASAWPSIGLHGSLLDLARLAAVLLQRERSGAEGPVSQWVIERQALVRADAVTGGARHYGQGLALGCLRNLEVRQQGGQAGTYGSAFALVPALGLGVVALFAHPAGRQVADRALSLAIGQASGTHALRAEYELPPTQPGVYWSAARERLELFAEGDALLVGRSGRTHPLARASRQLWTGEAGLTLGLVPWLAPEPGPRFVMLDERGGGLAAAVPYRREGPGWPPGRRTGRRPT